MLLERLNGDIKQAMLNKDKARLKVLRTLKSSVKQVQIDTRKDLSDDDVVGILKGELKKRKQAKELYIQGDRDDLVKNENFEMEIIQEYLPRALTEAELSAAVEEVIVSESANGMKDMGKVMKALKESLGNQADGKQLSIIVRRKLSE